MIDEIKKGNEVVRVVELRYIVALMNEIEQGTNPYTMDVVTLLDNWKRLKNTTLFFLTAQKEEIDKAIKKEPVKK